MKTTQFIMRFLLSILILFVLTSCLSFESLPPLATTATPMTSTTTPELANDVPPSPTILPGVTKTMIEPTPTREQEMGSKVWVTRDGWFLANQIRTMLLDESGEVLWAGGPDGLVQWDLKTNKFTIYVVDSKIHTSQVVDLAQTPDRSLWVGTFGNGITRINADGQWHTFTSKDGLPGNYISSLEVAPNGSLWVDTASFTDNEGDLERGYFGQFSDGSWKPGNGGGFFKVVASPGNDLWSLALNPVVDKHGSLARFYENSWEAVETTDEITGIMTFDIGPDGEIWVAAETGVFRFDGHQWKRIVPPWTGQTSARISVIEVSQNNVVWFGFSVSAGIFGINCGERTSETEEWGVYRYDGQTWTHFTKENGLVDNKICAITSSQDGRVWFGSFDKGVSQFDGQSWRTFVIP